MELSTYIGNKIRQYRKQNNLTQDELAKRLGLGKGTISNYESGYRTPQESRLFELAEALGVSINDLFPPTVNQSIVDKIIDISTQLEAPRQEKVYNYAEHELKEQNKVINLKEAQAVYLNSKLSAGTGILDLDPADTKEIEYSGYVPKHDLAFLVDGNSMTPTFEDGEVVFVEKTPDIHSGQFVAVQVNEEAFIKKAYIEDDRLRLVSLNKDYEDIYADGSDDIRIIGKVIL